MRKRLFALAGVIALSFTLVTGCQKQKEEDIDVEVTPNTEVEQTIDSEEEGLEESDTEAPASDEPASDEFEFEEPSEEEDPFSGAYFLANIQLDDINMAGFSDPFLLLDRDGSGTLYLGEVFDELDPLPIRWDDTAFVVTAEGDDRVFPCEFEEETVKVELDDGVALVFAKAGTDAARQSKLGVFGDIENAASKEAEEAIPGLRLIQNTETLYEDEDFEFTVTGYSYTDSSFSLYVHLVNNTGDAVLFSMDDEALNGVMCDPSWTFYVAGETEADTVIVWFAEDVAPYDITAITVIDFKLHVYSADSYGKDFINNYYTIYPDGEENAEYITFSPEDAELVLYDDGNYAMYLISKEITDSWVGPCLTFDVVLVNNTDKTVMFSVEDVAIDGIGCDPFWGANVAPGKIAVSHIYFYDDIIINRTLVLEDISAIDLRCSVFDYEAGPAETLAESEIQTITLKHAPEEPEPADEEPVEEASKDEPGIDSEKEG